MSLKMGIDGTALVKLVSPEEAKKARDLKLAQQAAKAAKAAEAKRQRLQKGWERILKGKQSPEELEKERRAAAGGAELSKNQLKKLAKEMEVQKGLHQEYKDYEAFLISSGKSDSLEAYEAYLEFNKK